MAVVPRSLAEDLSGAGSPPQLSSSGRAAAQSPADRPRPPCPSRGGGATAGATELRHHPTQGADPRGQPTGPTRNALADDAVSGLQLEALLLTSGGGEAFAAGGGRQHGEHDARGREPLGRGDHLLERQHARGRLVLLRDGCSHGGWRRRTASPRVRLEYLEYPEHLEHLECARLRVEEDELVPCELDPPLAPRAHLAPLPQQAVEQDHVRRLVRARARARAMGSGSGSGSSSS